jgi:hypothetical protein
MFSPKVRDSFAAIFRLRVISSSAAARGVGNADTGELKLMPDVADSGELVVPGPMDETLGNRTISTGRELARDCVVDAAAKEGVSFETVCGVAVEEQTLSARSGVSPRIDSTLRVDRRRRTRCA